MGGEDRFGVYFEFEPTGFALRIPVGRERGILWALLASAPWIAVSPKARDIQGSSGQFRSPAKASSPVL